MTFDIGGADPVTGEPFATIANRSRGMHKTQGLGQFSARTGGAGPNEQTFMLLAGDPPENDIMDGVDTTWSRIAGGRDLIPLLDQAIAEFNAADPAASVPALLALRSRLAALPDDPLVVEKQRDLDRIIQSALGLTIATTLGQAEVVPGEELQLHHEVTLTAAVPVQWVAVKYPTTQAELIVNAGLQAGVPTRRNTSQILPTNMAPSQPYWLHSAGAAGLFHVDDPRLIGDAENPPVYPVRYLFSLGDQILELSDEPVQIVTGAPAAQQRRRLSVIPPVSIGFVHELELFAPGETKRVEVVVTAARVGAHGQLDLTGREGWTVQPATKPFALTRRGEQIKLSYQVTAPARPDSIQLDATAEVGGARFGTQRFVLNYPHLPVQLLQPPAQIHAVSLRAGIRGTRVGYLPGAGDNTADSIAQLGYTVVPMTGDGLTPEKLAGLDAVVLGVRAFNDRDDLAASLPALFSWVESGGTLIAQYNRPNGLKTPRLGPYPLSIEGSAPALRVTDETAPVTILAPDHPALNFPNQITDDDFAGWVQERGAYFPSSWDENHYVSLLAMSDPGEEPLRSSLLVTRHGKGWYVYTGLSFFRQLPAGHPGAHRLFANLLSLGR